MSPVMWPRMRDDYEPGSANPGQSLVKSSSQDAWEPGAEPGGGGGGGGAVASVNGKTGTVVLSASDVGAQPAGSYATGAQGAKADTAVQPDDLADVATSGAYADLSGRPTIPSTPGDVGAAPAVHTHDANDIATGTLDQYRLPWASTTARGISELATAAETLTGTDTSRAVTPAGVKAVADTKAASAHDHVASDITSGTLAIGRIPTGTSGSTVALGNHTHTPASIGAATSAQGSLADTAVQPGDDAATLGSGAATDGQVLTADGAGGVAWAEATGNGGSPLFPAPEWDLPGLPRTGTGSETTTANFLYLSPFRINDARSLSAVMTEVTTAHAPGSVARLGIYRWTSGHSWERLLDAGTVAIDSIGVKAVGDLSLALPPGLYALGIIASDGSGNMGCWATAGGAYGAQEASGGITGNKRVYYGAPGSGTTLPATVTGSGQGGYSTSYTRGAVRLA